MTPLLYVRYNGPSTSFRATHSVRKTQSSYPLPPLSTILGLLAAAYGSSKLPGPLDVGYLFHANCRGVCDVKTIWYTSEKKKKLDRDVIQRELIIDFTIELFLRTPRLSLWEKILRSPYHNLYLGNSEDLVSLEEISIVHGKSLSNLRGETLYAGPSLYPPMWRKYLEPRFLADSIPAYIDQSRKLVERGIFLELIEPLKILNINNDGDHFSKTPVQIFTNNVLLVPTRLPGPAKRRVVYLWPISPVKALVEGLYKEWS